MGAIPLREWKLDDLPAPPDGWGEWHRYKGFRVFSDDERFGVHVFADFAIPSHRIWVDVAPEDDMGPSMCLEVSSPQGLLRALRKIGCVLGDAMSAWNEGGTARIMQSKIAVNCPCGNGFVIPADDDVAHVLCNECRRTLRVESSPTVTVCGPGDATRLNRGEPSPDFGMLTRGPDGNFGNHFGPFMLDAFVPMYGLEVLQQAAEDDDATAAEALERWAQIQASLAESGD